MKKILAILLVLVMVLGLAACGEKKETTPVDNTPSEPTYADHVTVAIDVLPSSYDASSMAFPMIARLVYDELIEYDKVTQELKPGLATSWSWKDEGSTILHLDLREGVTFHNGNPFTAEDVEFTLAHNGNANLAGYYDHCEIENDHSIDVVLKSGSADFVYILTNTLYAGIMDKESAEADANFGTAIGTGPWAYDLDNTLDGDRYEFVRNDNYWGELPTASLLTLRYIKESNARLIALQNKEIAAFCTVGETDREAIANDANLEYCSGTGVGPAKMYYIAFNMKTGKAANNLYLRQAVACAMNNAEIIAAYGDPGAEESNGAFWGASTPFKAQTSDFQEDLSFNIEKGKDLLKKAEEVNGGPIPTLTLLSNYTKAVNSTMCLAVQAECKAIGLDVEIIESDSAGVLALTKYDGPGDWDMIQYNVPLESWPSAVNRMLVKNSNNNRAILESDYVEDLLMKAAATNDEAAREQMYKEVQVYVHDNAIYIPVYYGSRDGAQLKGVEGIVWTNDGYPEFGYAKVPQ
ncbi:MAG: ABC transporter substrate-binding protein [Firmicutes bacterium]|nr:ABC transporter substrate-binding protein [Bacillota bacterium]